MVSDLVKTSLEIQIMLEDTLGSERNVHLKQMEKKFLVLSQGLTVLEEMLKEVIPIYCVIIGEVFARFKKENGI